MNLKLWNSGKLEVLGEEGYFMPICVKQFTGGLRTESRAFPTHPPPSLLSSVNLLHSFTTGYKTEMEKFTFSVAKPKAKGGPRCHCTTALKALWKDSYVYTAFDTTSGVKQTCTLFKEPNYLLCPSLNFIA